jgi:hypothetical protein
MSMQEVFVMTRSNAEDLDRDRSQYQRRYYEENKEQLSARRRQMYREDPEYRQAILERVAEYRTIKRTERARLREAGELPPSHPSGPRDPLTVVVNGVRTVAYTIGRMALELDRSKDVLNYWTRIGLLPQTPYRAPRGDRLYTEGMTIVVKIALGKRGRVSAKDREFTKEIRRGWEGLGVSIPVDKHHFVR